MKWSQRILKATAYVLLISGVLAIISYLAQGLHPDSFYPTRIPFWYSYWAVAVMSAAILFGAWLERRRRE